MSEVNIKRIAILGGGYAGMAAALRMQQAGWAVTVIEAAAQLGGRARAVSVQKTVIQAGSEQDCLLHLDNGQHILIGAYVETLRLLRVLHAEKLDAVLLRLPLQLCVPKQLNFKAWACPAPLHVLFGLLSAKGLTLAEKWAMARLMRFLQACDYQLAADSVLSEWLQIQKQPTELIRKIWEPLILATMNTPMQQASAQIFACILRDSLGSHAEASAFYLPKIDLGKLLPEAVAAYLLRAKQDNLHQIITGQRVRAVQKTTTGWRVLGVPSTENQTFDAVICAISPHRLSDLSVLQADGATCDGWVACQSLVQKLSYQPIYTVYLQYPKSFRLTAPMLGLLDGLGQWVFDRGQFAGQAGLLAVVLSAEGAHQTLSHAELVQNIEMQLAQALDLTLPPLLCWQVIAEKRATFSCKPDLERPHADIGVAQFALAGDMVHSDYPATLEGAVRSGLQAAELILKNSL